MKHEERPQIRVYYEANQRQAAEQVGFGIEEEGLPYVLEEAAHPQNTALRDTAATALGVAVSIDSGRCCVFCSQLKENRPFMTYDTRNQESLKRAGINAARIVKNRPFAF